MCGVCIGRPRRLLTKHLQLAPGLVLVVACSKLILPFLVQAVIGADEITGVILAGGKSTRMGQDKARLLLEGKPFIQHVVETLQCVFAEVIISANTTEYDFLGLPVVSDLHEDCGPLCGIHAVLGSVNTPYVFIAPCDTPLLTRAMVEALLVEAMPDLITIASTPDCYQPLVGIYPVTCRSGLEGFLLRGKRKVKDFLAATTHHAVRLDAWTERLESVNEVGQYRGLMRSMWAGGIVGKAYDGAVIKPGRIDRRVCSSRPGYHS